MSDSRREVNFKTERRARDVIDWQCDGTFFCTFLLRKINFATPPIKQIPSGLAGAISRDQATPAKESACLRRQA
jgi:hypothetical protein